MKKIPCLLVLLILTACSANKFDLQIVTNLTPAMEQGLTFAVVDFNPSERFVKDFDSLKLQPGSGDATAKDAHLVNIITSNWDALFSKLPANDYFLMNSVDSLSYTKTGGLFVPLSETWWVISKAFLMEGQPYCYLVQLDVKKGSLVKCRPDKSNLVLLTGLYENQILKKP